MKMKKNITFSSVIIFLVLCALLSIPHQLVLAETIIVTKFSDSNGDCTPTDCSLREAIIEANKNTDPTTITLTEGTYMLTLAGFDDNANLGDLDILSPINIIGAGPGKTFIDASSVIDGAFTIKVDGIVTISQMSIVNGHFDNPSVVYCDGTSNDPQLELDTVIIKDNSSLDDGGGLYSFECNVTIKHSEFINNSGLYGGAIRAYSGNLTIDQSTISNNIAYIGGGIYAYETNITIFESIVSENTSSESGGGIFAYNSTITLTKSNIIENIASRNDYWGIGGGIHIDGETTMLVIEDSLISGNTSYWGGGGIAAWGGRSLTIRNSTISGNNTGVFGGGVISKIVTEITHTSIVKNVVGNEDDLYDIGNGGGFVCYADSDGICDAKFLQSILADNIAYKTNPKNDCEMRPLAEINSDGYNLVESVGGCEFLAAGDITGVDPIMAPLQDNGGPTFTHAFLFGSPAIDAGSNTDCLSNDQRGNPRPVDGDGDGVAKCDIGAYESDRLWGVFLPLITR